MSIKVLKNILLTPGQKMLAETRYQADRSKKQLDEEYQPKGKEIRNYYESILIIDHKRQWDEHQKSATIKEDSLPE